MVTGVLVFPKQILTGKNSIERISQYLEEVKPKVVGLFIDPVLVQTGVGERFKKIFEESNVKYMIFSDIIPEPSVDHGIKAVQFVRDNNIELVIGVGGGSCLDCAKVAATLAKNEGDISNYLNLTGDLKLQNSGVYKILIPTTAGTGAEVTFNAVFSVGKTKDVISDINLMADVALVDPVLTYTMPPKVAASSGIDALIHALESYVSKGATTVSDVLALDAIERISSNIENSVNEKEAYEARDEMAIGSLISSLSYFNSGVHAVHALSYPLSGLYKIAHGESNAVLLPYVFQKISQSCEDKIQHIIKKLNNISGNSITTINEFVIYLKDLVRAVNLPTTLQEYNIKFEDIDKLVEEASKQTRLLNRSPLALSKDDIKEIYLMAYSGSFELETTSKKG